MTKISFPRSAAFTRLSGETDDSGDTTINVRKSNTEPLLRLCLEGITPEAFEAGRARVMPFLGRPVDR